MAHDTETDELPLHPFSVPTSSDTSEDEFGMRLPDPENQLPWQQRALYDDKRSTRIWYAMGSRRCLVAAAARDDDAADLQPHYNAQKERDFLPCRLPMIRVHPPPDQATDRHLDEYLYALVEEEQLVTRFSSCFAKEGGYVLSCTTLRGLRAFWRAIWRMWPSPSWRFVPLPPPCSLFGFTTCRGASRRPSS